MGPRQGRNPTRPAETHLRWKAARGRQNPLRLQHPEGVHSPSCVETQRCMQIFVKTLTGKTSLLMSSQLTPLRTSRPRSRTRKVSHQTSRDLSSLVSSSRMAEPFLTTTFRRSLPSTWSSDSEVETEKIHSLMFETNNSL